MTQEKYTEEGLSDTTTQELAQHTWLRLLINSGELEKAHKEYLSIDTDLADNYNDSSPDTRLNLLIDYCYLLTEKGHKLFDSTKRFSLNGKKRGAAIAAFEHIHQIIIDRLPLLNLNAPDKDWLALTQLLENTSKVLEQCELDDLPVVCDTLIAEIGHFAADQNDATTSLVIKLLGSAVCFNISYRRTYNTALLFLQRTSGVGAGFLVVFLLFLFI